MVKKTNKKIEIESYQRLIFKIKLTQKEYKTVQNLARKHHTTPQIYINKLIHNIYFNKEITSTFKKYLKKDLENNKKQIEKDKKQIEKDKKRYKILRF